MEDGGGQGEESGSGGNGGGGNYEKEVDDDDDDVAAVAVPEEPPSPAGAGWNAISKEEGGGPQSLERAAGGLPSPSGGLVGQAGGGGGWLWEAGDGGPVVSSGSARMLSRGNLAVRHLESEGGQISRPESGKSGNRVAPEPLASPPLPGNREQYALPGACISFRAQGGGGSGAGERSLNAVANVAEDAASRAVAAMTSAEDDVSEGGWRQTGWVKVPGTYNCEATRERAGLSSVVDPRLARTHYGPPHPEEPVVEEVDYEAVGLATHSSTHEQLRHQRNEQLRQQHAQQQQQPAENRRWIRVGSDTLH